jgi:peptidoglycan/LPS O-acetylase OafA/YrhL
MVVSPDTPSLTIPTPARLLRLLRNILPSFFNTIESSSRPAEIRSTAWLDGLRGWASLIVFFYHFAYGYHRWVPIGYGYNGSNLVVQLPFVRLITAGPAMVCLFFAISGYSLSWAPLKELHNNAPSKCLSRLASSTFRRPFRLFFPPVVASLIVVVFVRMGFYTYGDMHYAGWARFGFQEVRPPIYNTTSEQLHHYYETTSRLVNVFRFDNYMEYPYDGHLWTIPMEFRWSIVLFSVVGAISHARRSWQFMLMGLLFVNCIWYAAWEPMLFFGGTILAQFALWRGHGAKTFVGQDLPLMEYSEKEVTNEKRRKWGAIALFVIGLYLAGAPDWNRMVPSFDQLL